MKDFQKQFGLHLKQLRRSYSLSQEDLAAITGLSKQYVSTVERGISRPGTDTLYRLANGLGVTVSDLFRFEYETKDLSDLKKRIIQTVESIDDNASPEALYSRILNLFIKGQQ